MIAFKLWRYCVRHKDNEDKMVEKEMKKDQYYRSRDEVFSLGRSLFIKVVAVL